MCRVPTEVPAAERARWLAELSAALSKAHELLIELHRELRAGPEAQELYLRIEAARLEVHSLRLSRSLIERSEAHPVWTELLPWQRSAREAG